MELPGIELGHKHSRQITKEAMALFRFTRSVRARAKFLPQPVFSAFASSEKLYVTTHGTAFGHPFIQGGASRLDQPCALHRAHRVRAAMRRGIGR
jgi:hypothetical protein